MKIDTKTRILLIGAIAVVAGSWFVFFSNAAVDTNYPNLQNGLVGWWTFDGTNASFGDSSGNGNTGYLTGGATTTVAGVIGRALQFDGTHIVSVGNGASLTPSNTITLSGWVNVPSTGNQQFIIGKSFSSCGNPYSVYGLAFSANDGEGTHPAFIISTGSTRAEVFGPSNLANNTWYLLTGTWDGSTMKLYINGQLVNTGSQSGTLSASTEPTALGSQGVNGCANAFSGDIDDVRIYNQALSASQVLSLYNITAQAYINAPITPPNLQNGLVGWWTFDGNNMINNVADSSGTGNTGYMAGAATSSQVVPGPLGQALNFNGTSQYIMIPDSTSLRPSTFTISFWVSLVTTFNNYPMEVSKIADSGTTDYGVYFNGHTSKEECQAGSEQAVSNTALPFNKWIFVVCTYDLSNIKIWINGNLDTVLPFTSAISYDANPVYIADDITNTEDNRLPGSMDDVRIYNRALSAAEVQQLYNQSVGAHINAPINPPNLQNGLVGWWTFDGNNMINNVADSSGQGNTGDLITTATSSQVVPGVSGQALNFNGTSQYVDVAHTSSLDSIGSAGQSFSVAAWIRYSVPSGSLNYMAIMGKDNSGNRSFQLFIQTGLNIQFQMYDGTHNPSVDSSQLYNDGKWHYVVAVRDSGNSQMKIYIDGRNDSTGASNSNINLDYSSTNDVYIGNKDTGMNQFFNGSIDDVRIYNRALSAAEVTQLYNLGQ